MQLLNILCKLAEHYCSNKILFSTVQFMHISPKTTNYWQCNCLLVFLAHPVDAKWLETVACDSELISYVTLSAWQVHICICIQ